MKLQHLDIGYQTDSPIIRGADAELRLSGFVCLIGRNGTGKSTLLRTLAGLIPPLAGSIAEVATGEVAIVLTQTPDLRHTTVLQMVAYGRLPHTGLFGKLRETDLAAAREALSIMHLEPLAQRNFATLSDGERQKTMIARALAQQTPYLLLDEPSAFLDHPSKVELMETLQQLAHNYGKGVLLSTHDLELTYRFADQLWTLEEGRLIVTDRPNPVSEQASSCPSNPTHHHAPRP